MPLFIIGRCGNKKELRKFSGGSFRIDGAYTHPYLLCKEASLWAGEGVEGRSEGVEGGEGGGGGGGGGRGEKLSGVVERHAIPANWFVNTPAQNTQLSTRYIIKISPCIKTDFELRKSDFTEQGTTTSTLIRAGNR